MLSKDTKTLENLLRQFQFDIEVFSVDFETPLDLAIRLKQHDMCSLLLQSSKKQSHSNPNNLITTMRLTNQSAGSSQLLPYPTTEQFPMPNFSTTLISITPAGEYQVTKNSLVPVMTIQPATTSITDNQSLVLDPNVERSTPVSPISNTQLEQNLKCPLTKNIFRDPVIATDGITYEREAITEWTRRYACSPMTGEKMNATFIENTAVKEIIKSLCRG